MEPMLIQLLSMMKVSRTFFQKSSFPHLVLSSDDENVDAWYNMKAIFAKCITARRGRRVKYCRQVLSLW